MVEHWTPEPEVGVRNLPPPGCVLEQDIYSPKVLVIRRQRWLHSDMTEKLLTWTLSLSTNKQTKLR